MGKASRIKQQSAREKIAAQRAAAQRMERRNRLLITGGSTLLVLVIVGVFIAVKLSQGSSTSSSSSAGRTDLPASVVSQVTNVPASALNQVGKGAVPSFTSTPLSAGSGATMTSSGKPEMLYIGAEFCPYCAAMRWSMAIALSRFGDFTTPLQGIHSSSTDTDPNTATLTFYKAGYDSKYLTFTPVENLTVDHALLQNPTKEQNALWAKYEPDPNTRGYPFIDFGNKAVLKGPIYNPAVLAGKSWSQIAADLHNPSSTVAQNVLGAANYVTGAICKMTNNQPSDVCTSPAVTAVQSSLG
jgi:thiol-disulfide isomerase/thioredoxin